MQSTRVERLSQKLASFLWFHCQNLLGRRKRWRFLFNDNPADAGVHSHRRLPAGRYTVQVIVVLEA